jgi:hypothetical protein
MVLADYFRIFILQYTPSAEYKEYLFDSRSTSAGPSSNIYSTMTSTSADAQQIFTTLYHMVPADYFRIFTLQYTPSAEYKEYLFDSRSTSAGPSSNIYSTMTCTSADA